MALSFLEVLELSTANLAVFNTCNLTLGLKRVTFKRDDFNLGVKSNCINFLGIVNRTSIRLFERIDFQETTVSVGILTVSCVMFFKPKIYVFKE